MRQSAILAELLVDEAATKDGDGDVSYSSLARATLGGGGERAVGTLFVVLMVATLASQLSKAGGLVAPLLGLPYAAGVVVVAASLAAFSAANTPRLVSRANGVLTAGFAASLAVLCAFGARLADPALLVRALAGGNRGRETMFACLCGAPSREITGDGDSDADRALVRAPVPSRAPLPPPPGPAARRRNRPQLCRN